MEIYELVEDYREDIIRATQELISIESIEGEAKPGAPFGEGPREALDYMLDLGKELGFEVKNLDGYAGYIEFGEGEESLGILTHIDVVPEGKGWKYPAFGGEIHEGRIYGRGAVDDKGPTIASIYAMKIIKDLNLKLNKKIRLILGTNEETNWGCMDHYLKAEEPPTLGWTPDGDFPVVNGEKGIITFQLKMRLDEEDGSVNLLRYEGGDAANMVPAEAIVELESENIEGLVCRLDELKKKLDLDYEVGEKTITIRTYGVSSHGSRPETGDNAISHMNEVLFNIFDMKSSMGRWSKFYKDKIAFSHNGEKIGCGFEDDKSGKLTLNPGVIEFEDGEISLTVNVRYPVTKTSKDVYDGIKNELEETSIRLVESEEDFEPFYIDLDDPLIEKLLGIYRDEFKDEEAEPLVLGGGTYARAMDNIVAFGPVLPGQKELAHQANEFISIEQLLKLVAVYATAIAELGK